MLLMLTEKWKFSGSMQGCISSVCDAWNPIKFWRPLWKLAIQRDNISEDVNESYDQ
jgi:hypothetical protein